MEDVMMEKNETTLEDGSVSIEENVAIENISEVTEEVKPEPRKPLKKSKRINNDWQLHLMIFIPMVFLVMFTYVPILGLRLAFVEKLSFRLGIWGSEWAGLKWFKFIFTMEGFGPAFRNTLIIATSKLVLGFPVPIIVTLLLNEVRKKWYKKTVQTLIFLPYFISWVVLAGIIKPIFTPGGAFDGILEFFGIHSGKVWMEENLSFVVIVILTDIWKGFGYGTIVYFAALTGIDPTLYEAASLDGANKFKQALHVTLPCIMPIIMLNLILNLGSVINANFDQIMVLYNPNVYEWGDIIDTFVYRYTFETTSSLATAYPAGTAIGLFKSVVSLILICTSNWIVKKTSDYRIL